MSDTKACEVPFVEQLRSVPVDFRATRAIQWAEDGTETGHQFIPVGFMFHRAADELSAARAEIARLLEDAERYRALRLHYKDMDGYAHGFASTEDFDEFADSVRKP